MEVLVQDDIKRGVPSTSPKEVVISGVFDVKVEKVVLVQEMSKSDALDKLLGFTFASPLINTGQSSYFR